MNIPALSRSLAESNDTWLRHHEYFGRLVILGLSANRQDAFAITAFSGRSAGSQNRKYVVGENGVVSTRVVDSTTEVGNLDLTLYNAHAENLKLRLYGISNGSQTDDIVSSFKLTSTLTSRTFEPDPPHYTSRISARALVIPGESPMFEFFTHRRGEHGGLVTEYVTPTQLEPGFGLLACTYERNGTPLPQFIGGPRLITMSDDPMGNLLRGLSSLGFLVGIAVRRIPLNGEPTSIQIWNKHD